MSDLVNEVNRIVARIPADGRSVSLADLQRDLKMPKAKVQQHLHHLIDQGLVVRAGNGRLHDPFLYSLPTEGANGKPKFWVWAHGSYPEQRAARSQTDAAEGYARDRKLSLGVQVFVATGVRAFGLSMAAVADDDEPDWPANVEIRPPRDKRINVDAFIFRREKSDGSNTFYVWDRTTASHVRAGETLEEAIAFRDRLYPGEWPIAEGAA